MNTDAWAPLSDSTLSRARRYSGTPTQACWREEVQWKVQGIENPRVGGSIPPPGNTLQNNINVLILAH